ncbi:helix-turn-helix transcriptional regulator [Noviherbaspirillum autotrophicum]|uniref:helix-turn-helix transcriptional regulator n=1 Tax=Noviherbaspirillum autotrophicum TaxID=709839 RepID=UPI0006942AAE|nr:helix-turn-helix transcriptional regulator [Noviherbaspirillum autotrophicum]
MTTDAQTPLHVSIDPLLAKLYDGVTSANGFQDFIEALVTSFDLKAVTLIVHHAETHEVKGLWLCGITPDWVERYALDYAQEDMLAQHIVASPVAHFYASNLDVANPERFPQTRFFREWLEPQGVAYAAGAIVLREGAWCTQIILQRAPAQPAFSRAEVDMLDLLMPHMQRALQMRERFAELQLGQDFLAGGLDLLAMPTIFFDEHSRAAHLNKRAKALLAENSLLRLDDGHLVASNVEASRKLNYEIASAIQASRGGAAPLNEVVLLPRPERLPLMLMVAPLRLDAGQAHGAALLFVFDPDDAPSLTADRVRKLFGLSEAEAGLAVALCAGCTLEDIARERKVSPNTVKSQLKSVFAKTGTNRQTELVSMLLASPAYFLADRTSPN